MLQKCDHVVHMLRLAAHGVLCSASATAAGELPCLALLSGALGMIAKGRVFLCVGSGCSAAAAECVVASCVCQQPVQKNI